MSRSGGPFQFMIVTCLPAKGAERGQEFRQRVEIHCFNHEGWILRRPQSESGSRLCGFPDYTEVTSQLVSVVCGCCLHCSLGEALIALEQVTSSAFRIRNSGSRNLLLDEPHHPAWRSMSA